MCRAHDVSTTVRYANGLLSARHVCVYTACVAALGCDNERTHYVSYAQVANRVGVAQPKGTLIPCCADDGKHSVTGFEFANCGYEEPCCSLRLGHRTVFFCGRHVCRSKHAKQNMQVAGVNFKHRSMMWTWQDLGL